MRMGVLALFLAGLLGVKPTVAAPRWELGPKQDYGRSDGTVSLADGRLLTCLGQPERCELVDPATGEREGVPISYRAGLFASALALDNGTLLLPYTHQLIALPSGAMSPLPPAGHNLGRFRGRAISGGRAAFVSRERCQHVLFFLGASAGFRDVAVAPAGTCVHAVFDLEDGRVLIARTTKSRTDTGGEHVDFVALRLTDFSFELGPRTAYRDAFSVFRQHGAIVVLSRAFRRTADGGIQSEALFLDRNLKKQRTLVFAQGDLDLRVARVDQDRILFFDRRGSLIWDPTRDSLVRVPFPVVSGSVVLLRRGDKLFAFTPHTGQTFKLGAGGPSAPCDDIFMYAQSAVAGADPDQFTAERIEMLLSPGAIEACRAELDRQRRFPATIQGPLESLLRPSAERPSAQERVAARVVCTLIPKFSGSLIARINQSRRLGSSDAWVCEEASALHALLAVAGTSSAPHALVRYALRDETGRTRVRHDVPHLLESHPVLRRDAGQLLQKAQQRRASGYDTLRAKLCTPDAGGELARACDAVGSEEERDWLPRTTERPRILLNFGIATAVIGGLTTLAYVDRDGSGARAIAIGSGILTGGALGALGTFALSQGGGDTRGLGALLLAVPITLGGAVAGGAIAAHASRNPGDGRFATAAVPLSAAWLTGLGLTIDAW